MKILIVFGTRPEAIKMCPLVRAFLEDSSFDIKVCVTAQHREMLDQVLETFGVSPDFDLNLMKKNQTLEWLTGAIIEGVGGIIKEYQPDLVLVHGDTTTSFAAALAAFYQRVDVGHIEAGLRTGNLQSPWPEEANRKLTATLTKLHFAPTELAKSNLIAENHSQEYIYVTGNTVIDALLQTSNKIQTNADKVAPHVSHLIQTKIKQTKVLITGHRRENFGKSFDNICSALKELATAHPDTLFIYPVHLNPQVRRPVQEYLSGVSNIHLIEPLDYLSFVYLMNHADLILTDSGGIQEEAPSLGKPVLVMRENTERPEAVKAGTVTLVGTDKEEIFKQVNQLLNNPSSFVPAANPYGDGHACSRIVKIIKQYLGGSA